MHILKFLQDNTVLISLFSLVVSLISFFLTRRNYLDFAKNEFVKKQIEVVTDLVQSLHKDKINFEFTNFFGGSIAALYQANIFQLQDMKIEYEHKEFFENRVYFNGTCNQLINVKDFINNPFLPKSIADELDNFYTMNCFPVRIQELGNKKIIIIKTKYFEKGIFENNEKSEGVIQESNAPALFNWTSLIEGSKRLELAINKYLMSYQVKEINIRKKHSFSQMSY
jgi:hypothetical protein